MTSRDAWQDAMRGSRLRLVCTRALVSSSVHRGDGPRAVLSSRSRARLLTFRSTPRRTFPLILNIHLPDVCEDSRTRLWLYFTDALVSISQSNICCCHSKMHSCFRVTSFVPLSDQRRTAPAVSSDVALPRSAFVGQRRERPRLLKRHQRRHLSGLNF